MANHINYTQNSAFQVCFLDAQWSTPRFCNELETLIPPELFYACNVFEGQGNGSQEPSTRASELARSVCLRERNLPKAYQGRKLFQKGLCNATGLKPLHRLVVLKCFGVRWVSPDGPILCHRQSPKSIGPWHGGVRNMWGEENVTYWATHAPEKFWTGNGKSARKFFRPKFCHGRARGMPVPQCLFEQDLEGLTEVFDRMSTGVSGDIRPKTSSFGWFFHSWTLLPNPTQSGTLGNGVRKNGVRNRVRIDDAGSIRKFRVGSLSERILLGFAFPCTFRGGYWISVYRRYAGWLLRPCLPPPFPIPRQRFRRIWGGQGGSPDPFVEDRLFPS